MTTSTSTSSMPKRTEMHCFFSRVVQRETIEPAPGLEDWLPVSFCLAKQTRCWYDNPTDFTCETSTACSTGASIRYSSTDHRREYASAMVRLLSDIGVPQLWHPTILDELFGVLQVAVPEGLILVLIADVTVRLLGSFHDLDAIDTLMRKSPDIHFNLNYWVNDEWRLETRTMRGVDYHGRTIFGIPASRSSIESLQKVRFDSLEEATRIRNPSCCICKADFEQGAAHQLITPLPCTHCYHVDCIIPWLEVNHVCPLCRFALPTDVDTKLKWGKFVSMAKMFIRIVHGSKKNFSSFVSCCVI